jgi:hypothetical protein
MRLHERGTTTCFVADFIAHMKTEYELRAPEHPNHFWLIPSPLDTPESEQRCFVCRVVADLFAAPFLLEPFEILQQDDQRLFALVSAFFDAMVPLEAFFIFDF